MQLLCREFSPLLPVHEEKGLVGSQNYVKSHEGEMSSHVFNLNVDLAGQLLGGNVLGVTADPTVCAELKNLMEENQLGVTIKNQVCALRNDEKLPSPWLRRTYCHMHQGLPEQNHNEPLP